MNCSICGLPKFYGVVGYAGPQCTCLPTWKVDYGHPAYAGLLVEIERLREQLKVATAALYAIRDGATGLYGDDLDVCQKALRRIEGEK